jgi:hypothetical protein
MSLVVQRQEAEIVTDRFIWPLIFLLGLAIGFCNGLDQMVVGRSRFLVHESIEKQVAPSEEVCQGLDASFNLTTVSMYLGVTVGLVAVIGSVSHARRAQNMAGRAG